MAKKKITKKKTIEALTHSDDKRTNIPTAELEAVVSKEERSPIRVAIDRRDPDVDPQLVWRGKDLGNQMVCLLYTSPSPRDATLSRMPSSA